MVDLDKKQPTDSVESVEMSFFCKFLDKTGQKVYNAYIKYINGGYRYDKNRTYRRCC